MCSLLSRVGSKRKLGYIFRHFQMDVAIGNPRLRLSQGFFLRPVVDIHEVGVASTVVLIPSHALRCFVASPSVVDVETETIAPPPVSLVGETAGSSGRVDLIDEDVHVPGHVQPVKLQHFPALGGQGQQDGVRVRAAWVHVQREQLILVPKYLNW